MAQRAFARHLGVLHVAHELGRAPARRSIRAHVRREGRARDLTLLERGEKLLQRALVEARPDVTYGDELVAAVDAEQKRAQRGRASALSFGPAADDALHRAKCLDLDPGRRPRRRVVRVEALRDDPFEPLLFHRLEERIAAADELFRPADRTHGRERLIEDLLALTKRPLRQVLAVGPQDVEDLVHDGRGLSQPPQLGLAPLMHARLQPLERGHAVLVERDDLAVHDGLISPSQRLGDLVRLGVLRGAVEQIPGLQTDDPAVDECEGAHAVPLRLERELR